MRPEASRQAARADRITQPQPSLQVGDARRLAVADAVAVAVELIYRAGQPDAARECPLQTGARTLIRGAHLRTTVAEVAGVPHHGVVVHRWEQRGDDVRRLPDDYRGCL